MAHPSVVPMRLLSWVLPVLTGALLLSSVGLNLVLASRLRASAEAGVSTLAPGVRAPALHVRTLAGQSVSLQLTGSPTILYYFSPTCGWCDRNWLNVKALAAAVDGRYRLIGISTTTDVDSYALERGLGFEIYSGLTPEAARAYHFGGTPHTVVISATGQVERSWAGAYGPRIQREIERLFGIVLPGLLKTAVE